MKTKQQEHENAKFKQIAGAFGKHIKTLRRKAAFLTESSSKAKVIANWKKEQKRLKVADVDYGF